MKKQFVFQTCITVLLLAGPWLAGPALADSAWNIQTVDSTGNIGCHGTSLALDAGGNAHISYYDSTNADLKYAAWTGSSWNIETVDSEGMYPSLALDSSDYPHISYCDFGGTWSSPFDDRLKYAAWDGLDWIIQTPEPGVIDAWSSSLALDSDDQPHMSYASWNPVTRITFWYGVRHGSSWNIEPVDTSGAGAGFSNSIALDSNGRPQIAYSWQELWGGPRRLRYAWWNGSGWDIQFVGTAANAGWGISLALDSTEYPHISYLDSTNGNLKYAKWDGSEWHIQTVDNSGDVGGYETSLALDGSGFPHIVYYDDTNQDLKYAAFNGSTWDIETVDSTGGVGRYASLALDAGGNAHISYYDATNGDLKYACDPIEEILDFIEDSVDKGTLVPVKPGKPGQGQLGALINMVEAAGNLIDAELILDACWQLQDALAKTDGLEPPESAPDFVAGVAAEELASKIQELMTSLGCE